MGGERCGARLVVLLGVLEAFGPLSIDLYSPSLPHLARSLGASSITAQMTMSACMFGLVIGQLVSGPISDSCGRRRPVLAGVGIFTGFSVACAMAPSIMWLILFRFLQGVGGSVGMVVSLAVARDLFTGTRLADTLACLALVGAIAPVAAPVAGGQLARFMDWRGLFWILAVLGCVLLLAAAAWLPEPHSRSQQEEEHPASALADMRVLFADRGYRAILLIVTVSGATFFTYLSMVSFVIQDGFKVSAEVFGILFGLGSLCAAGGSQLNRLLLIRFSSSQLYVLGMFLAMFGNSIAVVSAILHQGLIPYAAGLGVYLASTGITVPNANALALGPHGNRAGSAAALLGTASFLIGPVMGPLISVGGSNATRLGVAMNASSLIALILVVRWYRKIS